MTRRSVRVPNGRLSWSAIVAQAKLIVESYDTPVTLRQLFYQLVAKQIIPNTHPRYRYLSKVTAQARRDGTFPDLTDQGREIVGGGGWDNSPAQALRNAAEYYSRDHSEGQKWSIYLAPEKAGMVNQLESWFGEFGVAIIALSGYPSQSFVNEIKADIASQKRPAALLGAGDHDPTGWDIWRDFCTRTEGCWAETHRVALDPAQPEYQGLPTSVDPETKKKLENDPRADTFVARFGSLTQVEVDALTPDVLRALFEDAIFGDAVRPGGFWDQPTYERVLAREERERDELIAFADTYEDES